MKKIYITSIIYLFIVFSCQEKKDIQLFDGQTLSGWEGLENAFRIENSAIIGGSLEKGLKKSQYLCTTEEFSDFELSLTVKLVHKDLKGNAGISFRAKRVDNSHRVASYQADIGYISPSVVPRASNHTPEDMNNPFSLWGSLLDECRADTSRYPDPDWYPGVGLKLPERDLIHKLVNPYDWNEMKIIARGNNIEIKVNGVTTIKYTEKDDIASKGSICLQAHSGDPYEVHYKDIRIRKIK